jgi:hypothetical protein
MNRSVPVYYTHRKKVLLQILYVLKQLQFHKNIAKKRILLKRRRKIYQNKIKFVFTQKEKLNILLKSLLHEEETSTI